MQVGLALLRYEWHHKHRSGLQPSHWRWHSPSSRALRMLALCCIKAGRPGLLARHVTHRIGC